MTTHVLARKWRPKDFSTLVGQEHVVKALHHALDTQRLHHAYLFTGTRGVGKTTIARILAKSVNCQTGISSKPCGQCQACVEIDQGRFVDLLEVDAATNTRVDEMRTLLENAMYAPTAGRYKVYVIDEVHMLSNSAFNAMLKTLEEPPPHIMFILATTDPQKIPVTVLSRCLQFNLKQMPPEHIVEHLTKVLTAEAVAFEPPALGLLAHAAHGSMRDALSLTDQAIAYSAGTLSAEAIRQMLGAVDTQHLVDILNALADRDGKRLLDIASDMQIRSLPFGTALSDLAALSYRLSVASIVPSAIEGSADSDVLMPLVARLSADELQLIYQIATHAKAELSLAPDEATGFGMALLRMLAFIPATPAGPAGPTGRTAVGSAGSVGNSGSAGNITSPARPVIRPAPPVVKAEDSAPPLAPMPPALPAESKPDVAANPVAPVNVTLPDAVSWPQIAAQLPASGLAKQCLQQSGWVSGDVNNNGIAVVLRVPIKSFADPSIVAKVQQLLEQHWGCSVKLQFEVGQAQHTAHAVATAQQADRLRDAQSSIDADPFINALKTQMGASVVPGSIRSLNS